MTTAYPGALDAFTNPTPSTSQATSRSHSEQHGDINDAVKAIEAALGTSGSPNVPGQLRADLALESGAGLVGFKQTGTGAVLRSLLAKLRDTVSVKDFGAVGDGVTDDTSAINTAITAAVGKVLVFPPGQYKTSATIILRTNTTIHGYGAEVVPISAGSFPAYAAINSAVDNTGGVTPASRPILSNENPSGGNSNIHIYGLKWTGNATGSGSMHGLHVHKVTGLVVKDCVTYECLSPIAILQSTDVVVQGCNVKGFRNGGIDTWTGCKRVQIVDNIIDGVAPNSDGTNIGIFVTSEPTDGAGDASTYHADDYLVAGNIITNIESHGIWIGGGDSTLNRVNDTARRVKVRGNIIRDVAGCGIILERSEDCVIDGNTLNNCGNHGILTRKNVVAGTAYVDRPTICNNRFRTVGTVTADSKFIHMDDTTRDASVYGNRGSGTGHTYALYDRATNSGLAHHGNRFTAGTSGTLNILTADDDYLPVDGRVIYRGGTTAATPITLFNAAVQGAVWEVVCRVASAGATSASYARFIVYGNTTLPTIVARETAGGTTYSAALSGTNVQITSSATTSVSVYTATPI